MKSLARTLFVGVALGFVAVAGAWAQTAISADGIVASTSGGFQFPDGTIQATAAAPGLAPVEDTGQQGCWDASGTSISCSGTGQDGELQRGVDWPTPRFTDNLDGTVTDNLTGLIWLKNADCFGARTWTDALLDANNLMSGSCGLTDGSVAGQWRLPNVRELHSLVDYGESSPSLPLGHPFTSVQLSFYWSSTTVAGGTGDAWGVAMADGDVDADAKTLTSRVWPVRGGQ